MARRSDTLGSDCPRSHFRTAPSDRLIARATLLVLPYESSASRRRLGKPSGSVVRGYSPSLSMDTNVISTTRKYQIGHKNIVTRTRMTYRHVKGAWTPPPEP